MRFPSLTMICSTALFFLLLDVCYAHPSPRPHEERLGPWQRHAARDMRRRSSFHVGGSNEGQLQKRGSFTYYEVGLGACGGTNSASDYVVALNAAQWDGGSHCYESVTITINGQSVQAQIVDQCPGCGSGDLDFSQGLFQHFADTSVGVLSGSFAFGSAATTTSQTPTTTQQPTTSSTSTYTPPSTTSTSQYTPTSTSSSTPPPTTSTSSTSSTSSTTSSSSSSSTQSATSTTSSSSSFSYSSSSSSSSSSSTTSSAPLTSTTTTSSDSYSGLQVLEQINSFVIQLGELAVVGAKQL